MTDEVGGPERPLDANAVGVDSDHHESRHGTPTSPRAAASNPITPVVAAMDRGSWHRSARLRPSPRSALPPRRATAPPDHPWWTRLTTSTAPRRGPPVTKVTGSPAVAGCAEPSGRSSIRRCRGTPSLQSSSSVPFPDRAEQHRPVTPCRRPLPAVPDRTRGGPRAWAAASSPTGGAETVSTISGTAASEWGTGQSGRRFDQASAASTASAAVGAAAAMHRSGL